MDLPFAVKDPATQINIYTVAAENASALEQKLAILVAGLAALSPSVLYFINGFSLGAAGDGGVFEASVTVTLEDNDLTLQVPATEARFWVQDAGTGDDSLGVTVVATADAKTAGTRLQRRIWDAMPDALLYGTRAAGCNAGRRLAVLALTANPPQV